MEAGPRNHLQLRKLLSSRTGLFAFLGYGQDACRIIVDVDFQAQCEDNCRRSARCRSAASKQAAFRTALKRLMKPLCLAPVVAATPG